MVLTLVNKDRLWMKEKEQKREEKLRDIRQCQQTESSVEAVLQK